MRWTFHKLFENLECTPTVTSHISKDASMNGCLLMQRETVHNITSRYPPPLPTSNPVRMPSRWLPGVALCHLSSRKISRSSCDSPWPRFPISYVLRVYLYLCTRRSQASRFFSVAGCVIQPGGKIRGHWERETAKTPAANDREHEPH